MTGEARGTLKITLVRSTIGRPADQGRTVASLGLRRLHATVERPDTPSIRGMVYKIRHLVSVEEVPARAGKAGRAAANRNGQEPKSSD